MTSLAQRLRNMQQNALPIHAGNERPYGNVRAGSDSAPIASALPGLNRRKTGNARGTQPVAPKPKPTPTPGPAARTGPAPRAVWAEQNKLPWDTAYQTGVNAATHTRDTALSNADYGIGNLGQTYGYSADAQGNAARVDPHDLAYNPFSKAALLDRNYQQTQNSASIRHHGYTGALENADHESQFQYNRGDDAVKREFLGTFQGLQASKASANDSWETTVAGLQGDATTRALATPPESATVGAKPEVAPVPPAVSSGPQAGSTKRPGGLLTGVPGKAGNTLVAQQTWLGTHPKWIKGHPQWAKANPLLAALALKGK